MATKHVPGAEFQPPGNQPSYPYTHLPEWARKALDQYESDCADGRLTFTGEFADESPDTRDGWVGSHLSSHVGILDVS